ncbi:hypothetical protein DEO72_LG3g1666 [Vigna unguiculata]|uniref:Uncharacterized protein n=1 Tax=Vigna unguiculata TaxID=3917 RepID=A0A4D6LF81_VIGUN|nr:hypothetical protein DEO72_LG3g1666 [Vigna unguiculata]
MNLGRRLVEGYVDTLNDFPNIHKKSTSEGGRVRVTSTPLMILLTSAKKSSSERGRLKVMSIPLTISLTFVKKKGTSKGGRLMVTSTP